MFFKEKWNGQDFACVIDGFKASSKRNCEKRAAKAQLRERYGRKREGRHSHTSAPRFWSSADFIFHRASKKPLALQAWENGNWT